MTLDELISEANVRQASDIHVRIDLGIYTRKSGEHVREVSANPASIEQVLGELLVRCDTTRSAGDRTITNDWRVTPLELGAMLRRRPTGIPAYLVATTR